MTRQECVEFLKNVEKEFPVNTWSIDGIDIWPLIKTDLFFLWFKKKDDPNVLTVYKKPRKLKKIFNLLKSILHLIILKTKKSKHIDYLFSGAHSHRVNLDNVFINRFYQPIMDAAKKSNKNSIVVEYSEMVKSENYGELKNLLFLHDYLPAVKLLKKISIKKNHISNVTELNTCLQKVREKGLINVDYETYFLRIIDQINNIKIYKYIFDIILEKYNPKLSMGLCYYNIPMYALNLSSYNKQIPSVDMQHGGQGELHVSYSGFINTPISGYNIMPKYFWCWDETSAREIKMWSSHQSFHQVIVGGNPWLSYNKFKEQAKELSTKKIILYTLQFNELDEFIKQAIAQTPSEYIWWLRMHPRKTEGKNKIIEELNKDNLLHKVNINEATTFPLPLILLKTAVHITKYSGSTIEAAQMGVPTIIIDAVGKKIYNGLISEQKAIVLEEFNAECLLKSISTIKEKIVPPTNNNTTRDFVAQLNDLILSNV